MNLLKFSEFFLCAIYFSTVIFLNAEPLTNRTALEKKFLNQRKKLAPNLYPIGGKLSKNYIEMDPVCGMKWWDIVTLCVRVAETLYDGRRLVFGLPGELKDEEILGIDGRVLFTLSEYQKMIRIKTLAEKENSSSDSEADSNEMINSIENIGGLKITSQDGVYYTEDGNVLVQLYALVDNMKLKRVHVHQHLENPLQIKIPSGRTFGKMFLTSSRARGGKESVVYGILTKAPKTKVYFDKSGTCDEF